MSASSAPFVSVTTGNASRFYDAGSDSDDEGATKKHGKDAVTVSEDMADLAISDSASKEYPMADDHQLLIKCALQLLKVNLVSGNYVELIASLCRTDVGTKLF